MQTLLTTLSPIWFAVSLAAGMLLAWLAGYLLGRTQRPDSEASVRAESQIDNASLALLGLLLGFTFAMAMTRFDRRRDMVVTDANAIGDFYTCVSLLRDPARSQLQRVVRKYVQDRLSIARPAGDDRSLEPAISRAVALQEQMTQLVDGAVRQPDTPAPVATVLVQKLTDLTSSHAARLAAARAHLPVSIVALLLMSALVSSLLLGREQGQAGVPHYVTMPVFILLISFVVCIVMDLNQPRRGWIIVSQEPMQRLLDSIPAPAGAP